MDDATLRNQIGSNIAAYRKQAGLTQAGLAEKLNYSDKAVSKWERGESVPDVMTLVQLAELFRIPVGELLADPDALPGNPGTLEKAMTQVSEKALKRKANKNVILAAQALAAADLRLRMPAAAPVSKSPADVSQQSAAITLRVSAEAMAPMVKTSPFPMPK